MTPDQDLPTAPPAGAPAEPSDRAAEPPEDPVAETGPEALPPAAPVPPSVGWGAPQEPVPPPVGWWAPRPTAPADAAPADAAPPYAGPSEPTSARQPTSESAPAGRSGRGRGVLVGALAGALAGALVAGTLVAVFDDDPVSETRVVRSETTSAARSRPATVVDSANDIRAVLEKVQPAVVRIDIGDGFATSTGSGFIISSDGVIVTNAHVVSGSDQVSVTLDNGDVVEGDVLGADESFDLAVVDIDRTGLPTADLGKSDELLVGDTVLAIGSALGLEGGSGPSVTTGIVSALDRRIQPQADVVLENLVQTDAAINPGNSGGPLVDVEGRVVGINTAIANPGEANNVGFAIPISSAEPVIDDLREGRTPQVAFLGVATRTVTPAFAEENSLEIEAGAYVEEVTDGSGAAAAGIAAGDVIVEIDGSEIARMEQVASAVRRNHPGDVVEVTVDRDGESRTFEVELTAYPERI